MTFEENEADYKAKLERFAKAHPDATRDDLEALFPRMNSASAIWARFNGSGKRSNDAGPPAKA
jgi:hypothetical protein